MMAAESIQPAWRLSELLKDIVPVSPDEDVLVSGLASDSRLVQPGDLFLACAGDRCHGLDFAADALGSCAAAIVWEPTPLVPELPDTLRAGHIPALAVIDLHASVGVIADRFFAHPSQDLYIVGVAGTDGKTTCAHFVAQVLGDKQHACGVIGTLGNGLYGQLEQGTHTTPDSINLHTMLAGFRDQGLHHVAMEVSSHALDQGRVSGVQFDTALFTNLGRDHLDYHGSVEAYGRAKRRLFESPDLRTVVLNMDDPFSAEIVAVLSDKVKLVAYGLTALPDWVMRRPDCDHVLGKGLTLSANGISMELNTSWGDGNIECSLLGEFNASNLLGTLGVALASGLPLSVCLERLQSIQAIPGRMECFGGKDGQPLVVVDYAHTPQALDQALIALREVCRGSLWCVFGAGGDRDKGKRSLMGAGAERYADRLVLTDDNPRGENPQEIVKAILSGMTTPDTVLVEHDRGVAIRHAVSSASANDIVLIAGKGHESYQEINGRQLSFDDRAHVAALVGWSLS